MYIPVWNKLWLQARDRLGTERDEFESLFTPVYDLIVDKVRHYLTTIIWVKAGRTPLGRCSAVVSRGTEVDS